MYCQHRKGTLGGYSQNSLGVLKIMKRIFTILSCCLCICILFVDYANSQSKQDSLGINETFVPFKHMSGIEPGESRLSSVLKSFGKPQREEITKTGDKVIQYTRVGLSFLITAKSKETDPIIDAVWAEEPYKGRSPNGLIINMSSGEAVEICMRDYYRVLNLSGSMYFSKEQGGEANFQVWFEDGKLIRIKIFRGVKSKGSTTSN
jgi:hypothetical protein